MDETLPRRDTPDKRWVKILEAYLPSFLIDLPRNPGIINVGCGNSVTWSYLGVMEYLTLRGLGIPRYVGVDQREEAFAKAKKILEGLVEFIVGDARNLTSFLSGTYHLAIFEHPDLTISPEGPKKWRKIFRETAMLLCEGGGAILTSFWLQDHIPAQVALERAGYRVLFSGRNKFPGKYFDIAENGESLRYHKYIAVAKRP